jgi:hypothetical protein
MASQSACPAITSAIAVAMSGRSPSTPPRLSRTMLRYDLKALQRATDAPRSLASWWDRRWVPLSDRLAG